VLKSQKQWILIIMFKVLVVKEEEGPMKYYLLMITVSSLMSYLNEKQDADKYLDQINSFAQSYAFPIFIRVVESAF
jgi:hypothetical protein